MKIQLTLIISTPLISTLLLVLNGFQTPEYLSTCITLKGLLFSALNMSNYFSPLKRQSQQLLSVLSSASDFKSHFCKQYGPRSDCSPLGAV